MQNKFSHISMCHVKLKEHVFNSLRFASDAEGLELFLKVASSLDSLVLGETQILGQMKKAYLTAKLQGFANKKATQIFDYCFRVSKRIRNETDLFKNVISIGHLAVEFAQKEFSDIANKSIVIFGAGEMATITAKHFLDHGAKKLFIANRTFKNAQLVSKKLKATPLELSDALKNIENFDICVTACGGDDLLITHQYFQNSKTHSAKQILFIDISVPRKIDPLLSSLPNLKLFNIDQLGTIVETNKEARKCSIKLAENIISEEIKDFFKKKKSRENEQNLQIFNAWLNDVVQTEVDRFLEQKSKNESISSAVVARSVCKKVSAKMRQKLEI